MAFLLQISDIFIQSDFLIIYLIPLFSFMSESRQTHEMVNRVRVQFPVPDIYFGM